VFIFQFKPLETEPKGQRIWSIGAIQKSIGFGCSDEIAKQVLKTTKPDGMDKKISEIRSVLGSIAESRRSPAVETLSRVAPLFVKFPRQFLEIDRRLASAPFNFVSELENEKVAKLFEAYPDRFVATAAAIDRDAADSSVYRAFSALQNEKAAELFVKKPDKFIELAKATESGIKGFFEFVASNRISGLFARHSDEFIEIAKALGGVHGMSDFIADNAELFDKHPDRFVALARAAGPPGAGGPRIIDDVVLAFKNEGIAKAFGGDPDPLILAVAKLKESEAIGQPIGRWDLLMIKSPPANAKEFIETMGRKDKADQRRGMVDMLPKRLEDSTYVKVLSAASVKNNYARAVRLAKSLGAHYTNPAVCLNFSYALKAIGEEKTRSLYKKAGMEYFARYHKEVLDEAYRNLDPKHNKDKPVLLVSGSKNEWAGISYLGGQLLGVLTRYYKLMIVEVDSKDAFYDAVKRVGGGKVDGKPRKIDTWIVAGHEKNGSILFGPDTEKGRLGVKDKEGLRALKGFFVDEPLVLLESCSTGASAQGIGAAMSENLAARLFAPAGISVGLPEFDGAGRILDVNYFAYIPGMSLFEVEKREFVRGKERRRAPQRME
jgi:hypothetical protein